MVYQKYVQILYFKYINIIFIYILLHPLSLSMEVSDACVDGREKNPFQNRSGLHGKMFPCQASLVGKQSAVHANYPYMCIIWLGTKALVM